LPPQGCSRKSEPKPEGKTNEDQVETRKLAADAAAEMVRAM
jgi:hypothetical protein